MFATDKIAMLDGYRLFTLTHRHATLDQLEPFVLADDQQSERLDALRKALGWEEVFYMATCNRVLYFFYQEDRDATSVGDFCSALGVTTTSSAAVPVFFQGADAVMHLYDVAASIDSMVVGEREILRQLRLAYLQCHECGLCGDHLRLVMQSAVAAAKSVYHETRIGQKPVSVVSLAAQRIRQQRLDPTSARVLLVGAGQTNWLISKFLRKMGYQHISVVNRTLAKAQRLARTYKQADSLALADLDQYTGGFDLMIVATAAVEPIITTELFRQLLQGEDATDKVVVDLSIPHNVAAEVVEQYAPNYIQIDDLRKLAQDNLAFRTSEVQEARKIIGRQLLEFRGKVQERRVELALSHLPEEIRAIRQRAVNEVFRRELSEVDHDTRELIDRMMSYMEKKCIGVPMKAARKAVV